MNRELSPVWTAAGTRPEWRLTVVPSTGPAEPALALEALDDRALAGRAAAGDRAAFDVLVTRHQRPVYQLCFRFLRDHADAADAMQDAFVRAWRALPRFKGDATFATWLYRVAVNTCLSRLAGRRPAADVMDLTAVPDSALPNDARLMAPEQAAALRRAVDQLPERQRATVILRVFHDLSHAEIAAVLGNSVGAVKANFFHALRNLRRLLSEDPR